MGECVATVLSAPLRGLINFSRPLRHETSQ
ncbi:hypothetical protein MY5147_006385 [Beauveria neobassiana]